MAEFKPGDIVRLKSGGRDMTVCYLNGGDSLGCIFDGGSDNGLAYADVPSAAVDRSSVGGCCSTMFAVVKEERVVSQELFKTYTEACNWINYQSGMPDESLGVLELEVRK